MILIIMEICESTTEKDNNYNDNLSLLALKSTHSPWVSLYAA